VADQQLDLMARPDDVTDSELRELILTAEAAIDAGDYNAAVQAAIDAYSMLIDRRPDVIVNPRTFVPRPSTERAFGTFPVRPWPDVCGVDLVFDADAKPFLRPTKERFTFSDAVTVMEYTLDTAVRAQRTPLPSQ
jgi:hypothetical protein